MGSKMFGKNNPNWRGGRVTDPRGYVLIRVGVRHHLADVRGYAYEHRLIGERILGRRLRRGEHVHHDDEHKGNNKRRNLIPTTAWKHRVHHRNKDRTGLKLLRNPGERNPLVTCACGCRKMFRKFDMSGRLRQYISGHNSQAQPTTDAILSVLTIPLRTSEIAQRAKKMLQATKVCLSKMKRKGLVDNSERGIWRKI